MTLQVLWGMRAKCMCIIVKLPLGEVLGFMPMMFHIMPLQYSGLWETLLGWVKSLWVGVICEKGNGRDKP